MKKLITMILAITLAITAIAPSDKANAEETPGTAPADKANAEEAPETTPAVTQEPAATPEQTVTPPDATPVPSTPAVITYAPTPTQTLKKQKTQEDINIFVYDEKNDGWYGDKTSDTRRLTKGFALKMRLKTYFHDYVKAQWTSNRPDIASVDKSGLANGITVRGKKYGKATITAEYNGMKTYVIVNVVKNEYKKELEVGDYRDEAGHMIGKTGEGIISIKIDSKGNLKCVFAAMTKTNKKEMKWLKKHPNILGEHTANNEWHLFTPGRKLDITDSKGKTVLKRTITNTDKDNFCCSRKDRLCHEKGKSFDYKKGLNKPRYIKFTVKKKYLKKLKGVDLRTCEVEFNGC